MFISVSQNLPKTSYIKMVDVWLIFAQLVPWVEVCIAYFFCQQVTFKICHLLSCSFAPRCCYTQQWKRLGRRKVLEISTTMARSYRSLMNLGQSNTMQIFPRLMRQRPRQIPMEMEHQAETTSTTASAI